MATAEKISRYPVAKYTRPSWYTVDDVDPDEHGRDDRLASRLGQAKSYNEHRSKCDLVRSFADKLTNCEFKSVRFPQGTSRKGFSEYWKQELSGKGAGDLIIIYYHGRAGGNGEDFEL